MEKDLPPPYSEAVPACNVGFQVPPNSAPAQSVIQGQQTIYPPPGTSIVVTNASLITPVFGPHPQPVNCPYCHQQTTTKVMHEPNSRTHLIAILMSILCCIPCCILPYCMGSCQNRNHYCSKCSAYLGMYSEGGVYGRRA